VPAYAVRQAGSLAVFLPAIAYAHALAGGSLPTFFPTSKKVGRKMQRK